ncbi:MAG: glutathione S-transferase family protein [Gammaproteobacteria bacterium]|nr:glutathione S-transferase family protein [Gammaproteobacteria bacterium]MDE2345870.1 glutathione S-transferase family protein [Gammaproteobacteria bacterium]
MKFELYYWPGIQGRGEFIRLALEEAGAEYQDVARDPGGEQQAVRKLQDLLGDSKISKPPFAVPVLKHGELVIAQTANILLYLGAQLKLAPADEAGRLWANQLQLTVTDWVVEIHDTHHPLGPTEYYQDQKPEARKRSQLFLKQRLPKYLGYFERVLLQNPSGKQFLVGDKLSYPDLSLFQVMEGLRYAFPRHLSRVEKKYPGILALHDHVQQRPRIAAYLVSGRRLAFNEDGLFRHYPELDD